MSVEATNTAGKRMLKKGDLERVKVHTFGPLEDKSDLLMVPSLSEKNPVWESRWKI